MVLYPLNATSHENKSTNLERVHADAAKSAAGTISAWDAVEHRQKQRAHSWWLVAQPDHAALSGDLAASISSPHFPALNSEVVQAISLHDEGWRQFDSADGSSESHNASRKSNPGMRPLSFLDVSPSVFLRAWKDSIHRAVQSSSLGGVLVSGHFSRLAENRLQSRMDSFQDAENLRTFLADEAARRRHFMAKTGGSEEEIRCLVDVLQFCDLLSLYLCCGAPEHVEFPQQFEGLRIRLRRHREMCRTDPPIFKTGVSLGVIARRYPLSQEDANVTTIGFLLA
jgi:hypothetical protein